MGPASPTGEPHGPEQVVAGVTLEITVADYRWLTSNAALRWLAVAQREDEEPLALITRLRKSLTPTQAHLIAEQRRLRVRARVKFSQADRMLFTAVGLQQATGEPLARYKADRFAMFDSVADLCCGLGGDLLSLAQACRAIGIDHDEITAELCRHNVSATGSPADVECRDGTSGDLGGFDAWHIDPDRRPEGTRTVDPARYSPPLAQVMALWEQNPHVGIKLAPAAPWECTTPGKAQREWVGWGRECQQQIIWGGALANRVEDRCATVVDDHGQPLGRILGSGNERVDCRPLGRYLMDPHAAIIAAGLVDALAQQHDLARLDARAAYLSADHPFHTREAACFKVLESLPFDERTLRAYLKQHDLFPFEVKKRVVEIDPEAVRKRLRKCGTAPCVLILAPCGEQTHAIVAQRTAVPT